MLANHFTLGWGLEKVPAKTREVPNLKSSIVDYQNQKEEKHSRKKGVKAQEKDHELFFDFQQGPAPEPVKLPKLAMRLPPGR